MMNYYEDIIEIGGLETAIIYFDKMDAFLRDNKLLEALSIRCIDIVMGMVEDCRLYDLRLGIITRKYTGHTLYMPTLCMIIDDEYYHGFLKEPWICRECKCDNGTALMALVETSDGFIYPDRKAVKIPKILKKTPCKKCGKTLQNHIVLMS